MNIVVVDDERVIRQGLKKIIEMSSPEYKVVGEAADGQEACELLGKEPCDLLITDIRMPIMDGLELIKKARESNLILEIVILSGYGEFDYAQEAIRMGVMGYILKPMNPDLVREVLDKAFRKLLDRERSIRARGQFFKRCSDLANELAEALWQLDARQIQANLSAIESEVTELAVNPVEETQIYSEFVSWIVADLEANGRVGTPYNPSLWEESQRRASEAKHRFAVSMEHLEDDIRNARNWGKHGPIREAIDFIQEHYADPDLSLQEVLRLTGLSATYFYELFKAETGYSFKSYLIRLRIDRAKLLLRASEHKTYEVGEKVGYLDYPHFAKLFKKIVGASPSEYKRQINGEL